MYSAFGGAVAPGLDELRAYLSLLVGRLVVNQFVQQVSRHAVVTVLSSLLSPVQTLVSQFKPSP
jgi:uncharacterized protein YggT (Ycf19 family)